MRHHRAAKRQANPKPWMMHNSEFDLDHLKAMQITQLRRRLTRLEDYRLALTAPLLPFEPLDEDMTPYLVNRDSVAAGRDALVEIRDLVVELHAHKNDLFISVRLPFGDSIIPRDAAVIWVKRG